MKPSFLLFHTESVNLHVDSVCHVILVPVLDGEMQEPKEFFFNPEAKFYLVSSGITKKQVESFPKFAEAWGEVQALFDQFPIAVCTAEGYSARAIQGTLARLVVDFKPIRYCNVKAICRRTLNEVSYCFDYLNFKFFGDAIFEDEPVAIARRWCRFALDALASSEDPDIDSFLKTAKIKPGAISPEGFVPSRCIKIRHYSGNVKKLDTSAIVVDADPENPFYQSNVVFTGKLDHLTRNQARTAVITVGGMAPEGMNKETDYLVVGVQDLRIVGEKGLSAKMKKAEKYKNDGLPIEIIDEHDFIEMIGEDVINKVLPPKKSPFEILREILAD